MKILFETLYDDTFSSRFRIYQFLPYFREAGLDFDVVPAVHGRELERCRAFPRLYRRWRLHLVEVLRRRRSVRASHRYDAVVVQKGFTTLSWRGWVGMQRAQGVPFILDIDDAVHLQPSLVPPRALRPLWDRNQIAAAARAAAAVVVGNRFLADDLARHAARVVEIPTCVDLRRYTFAEREAGADARADDPVVVGWSGSGSGHGLLNTVLPVIRRLYESHPNLRMSIVSNTRRGIDFSLLGSAPVKVTRWSPDEEVPALQAMDIGLMPLADTPWMKYKCALKALQYMAAGAATVCSPVGVNADLIDHGRNGLLASSPEEWYRGIERLVTAPALRRAMAREGRKTVEMHYSVAHHARCWLALLESAACGKAH